MKCKPRWMPWSSRRKPRSMNACRAWAASALSAPTLNPSPMKREGLESALVSPLPSSWGKGPGDGGARIQHACPLAQHDRRKSAGTPRPAIWRCRPGWWAFVIFFAFPILATLYFSLTQWTLVDQPVWIGLDNYVRMFTRDPLFASSLKATTLFVALSLPLKLVLGLMLALLLNLKIPGMNFFRTVFFIPAVISGVAVSLMWIWFLQPDTGVVNTLLQLHWRPRSLLVLGFELGAALGRHHEHLESRRRRHHLPGRLAEYPGAPLRSGRD